MYISNDELCTKIAIRNLNVRKGPGINHAISGEILPIGTIFTPIKLENQYFKIDEDKWVIVNSCKNYKKKRFKLF